MSVDSPASPAGDTQVTADANDTASSTVTTTSDAGPKSMLDAVKTALAPDKGQEASSPSTTPNLTDRCDRPKAG